MADTRPTLSLIVPAFNEFEGASEILEFYRQICGTHPQIDFELVVVDDGSTDGTISAIERGLGPDDRVRLVTLSRNFGSHAAISAGLAHAFGAAALTLSADRQEPLDAISQFIDEWMSGADIVWGLRSARATKKGLTDSFATGFSKVYQKYSDVPTYPREGPSQILVTRAVIDVLLEMPELNRNVLAMAAWTGFDQRKIFFEQLSRPHGVSKWTSQKKAKLVVDSFVEFSHAPLQWIAFGGLALGALGAVALLTALVLIFTPAAPAAGTALIAGIVLAAGGMNLVGMGVVGEYVWRAGDDARHRPLYIVKSVTESVGRGLPNHAR